MVLATVGLCLISFMCSTHSEWLFSIDLVYHVGGGGEKKFLTLKISAPLRPWPPIFTHLGDIGGPYWTPRINLSTSVLSCDYLPDVVINAALFYSKQQTKLISIKFLTMSGFATKRFGDDG